MPTKLALRITRRKSSALKVFARARALSLTATVVPNLWEIAGAISGTARSRASRSDYEAGRGGAGGAAAARA